jgi:2'-phosphotransferase
MDVTEQLKQADKNRKKGPSQKLRGNPRDEPRIRISKSLSWLLRHGANNAGMSMREDGYAQVSDVVSFRGIFLEFAALITLPIALKPHVQRYQLLSVARYCEAGPKATISSFIRISVTA